MKLLSYAIRNLLRSRLRTLATVLGVAISIFMLCAIMTINAGVGSMAGKSSSALTLVVFQKNRY